MAQPRCRSSSDTVRKIEYHILHVKRAQGVDIRVFTVWGTILVRRPVVGNAGAADVYEHRNGTANFRQI